MRESPVASRAPLAAVLGASIAALGLLACSSKSTPTDRHVASAEVSSSPAVSSSGAPSPASTVISVPAKAQPATHLVVFLHGVGANAVSFSRTAGDIADALPHAEIRVPDGFHPFDDAPTGRQWFSMHDLTDDNRPARVREAGAEVSRFVDGELDKAGLAGDKLVVVGFSQGAMVAAWLAVHRTPRPAAVVLLSGRVIDPDPPVPGSGPAVFIAHGDRDRVLSVSFVEPGARTLEAWGAKVTTHVYPGLDHHVDPAELADVRAFLRGVVEPP